MPLSLTQTVLAPETDNLPPLVIAHGLYGSGRNFNSLAKRFAQGRRVILVDMRNHGESPWAPEMDYAAMGDDLAETIAGVGGRAVVLGHSMGGKAAMGLALSHPERIAGLIVADIAPVPYTHGHDQYIDAMRAVDLSAVSRRSDADPMLSDAIPEAMLRAFLLQNLVVEGGRARWRINLDALAAALPDLLDWPTEWPEDAYEGPTLFLHGGGSDYVTAEMHPRIRGLFPDAEFQALPGAGHWLHAEQPDAFAAAVTAWLGGL
ncbi:MAG: alpha/beta fold hydrolase [Pseudomonadota bacterium]